jgi:hypothetical protein
MAIVLTNSGKGIITNRLKGAGTEPNWLSWGTGAGVADPTDTTLFSESSETRVAGTSSRQTSTDTNDTYQVVGTLTATASRAITNAGLWDLVSGGNLFIKGDFATINLAQNDSIQFTVKAVFST